MHKDRPLSQSGLVLDKFYLLLESLPAQRAPTGLDIALIFFYWYGLVS